MIDPNSVQSAKGGRSVELLAFAPVIDRIFRFIEMIGVTALLVLVLGSEANEAARNIVSYLGALLATMYLTEPMFDALTDRFARHATGEARAWRIGASLFGSSILMFLIAPFVQPLASAIAATLGR